LLRALCPPAASGTMGAAADAEWLRWVTEQFGNIAGKDKEISLEEFKTALQVKESFFAERFFALFDSDGSGTISLEELLGSLSLLVHGNSTDKLRFLFQVYDVDGKMRKTGLKCGSIDVEELRVVLRWCLRESSIVLPEERLGALSQALFQAADRDHSGSITFQELREELEAFPEVMENLTISAASWLKPPAPRERRLRPRCLSREFWHNHRGQLGCLGGYAGLNLLLFALGALRHLGHGPALPLARGCGQCLNLNCALLAGTPLLPLPTRRPRARHPPGHPGTGNFPNIPAKPAGSGRAGAAEARVLRCPRLSPGQRDGQVALGEFLLRARPGGGGVAGTAPQTGLALLALLLAMLLCSSPCVRRGGHFEIFYWSHLSYIPVWILLLLHGPHFWKWFVIPGSLFVLEKALGLAWRRAGGLRILEANLLPSQVTHLVIQRPKSFRFKAGDYLYLNIPAIAAYEWHPFSISSAPEQPETLWLHIRALGQWTTKLYEYFQQLELPSPEPKPSGSSRRERRSRSWEQCYIDGPYGTPSRRIFTSEHAVLIGAGIGITPFASILQSIMFRYRRRKRSCPSCRYSWCEDLRDEEMALRKVDFIWITRDQKHFEWFLSLLAKLESEQAELEPGGRFLELHLFMTSALGKSDVKALGLQVALDLLAAKENRDSITGLRTRTQPGRPDWSKVFGKVAEEKRGKVQVFFCGSPALAKVIQGHCQRFGFRFSKENF
ncbi:NOX5 oxidase, partial [Menura novaehollandiae]|nr:NOX5 oxidase [Menura novaehollandiae]